jgi:hypothetical protein
MLIFANWKRHNLEVSRTCLLEGNKSAKMMYPTQTLPLSKHVSCDSISSLPNSIASYNILVNHKVTKYAEYNHGKISTESQEAPAKLNFEQRPRVILTDFDSENFIQLEIPVHSSIDPTSFETLQTQVKEANLGLRNGIKPKLADGGMGGTYLICDNNSDIILVCKPGDEEPNSPHNPHQIIEHPSGWGGYYKGHILPGFGMYREVAACILDKGFSGVPPTLLARVKDTMLKKGQANHLESSYSISLLRSAAYKICSIQCYVRNECSAEDMGPGRFSTDDVQRIAVFDIRLCNLDRHEGNMLVCRESPYRRPDPLLQSTGDKMVIHDAKADKDRMSMDEESPNYRLVPIDHGYILPHVLYMGDPSLAWMNWPQSSEPISPTVQRHIESLDYARDAELLRKSVGAALPDTSLLTLQVCTSYLKKGARAGLTLRELGVGMCPADDPAAYARWTCKRANSIDALFVSPLQRAVHIAAHRVIASVVHFNGIPRTIRTASPLPPGDSEDIIEDPPGASPTSIASVFSDAPNHLCPNCKPDMRRIASSSLRVDEATLLQAMAVENGRKLTKELNVVLNELIAEILALRS